MGTELLLGDIMNTNAAFLARELAALGISVYHQTVVGDNGGRLREAVSLALSRSDLLVMTGGLGADLRRHYQRDCRPGAGKKAGMEPAGL